MPTNQNISVRSDTLSNLIRDIENGNFRIPQFQREFVWNRGKIAELFDSIYNEYPIGSFFLWKAEKEFNNLFRATVNLGVKPIDEHDNVSFILDGQQRTTSLYVALRGMTLTHNNNSTIDYTWVVFDLAEKKFTVRRPNNKRYVSVSDIWGPDALDLLDQIEPDHRDAFKSCWKVLQTYPVSIVEVRDKKLHEVCKIFQRINQAGKRLERFDMIAAMTFTVDFDLRERFKSDVLAPLSDKRFGKIAPVIATQLMALNKVGSCTERDEYGLKTEDIKDMWDETVKATLLGADMLRSNFGVINSSYLPYDAVLTLLAYYFLKSKKRAIAPEHFEWISEWFWRSSFGTRYGAGGPSRISQDRILFDALLSGKPEAIKIPINLLAADLIKIKMTQTRGAIRNAFLCLLATKDPIHLENNSRLDLINNISGFTSNEKHHIFPKSHLDKSGIIGANLHALPNFCYLPAELNNRISDTDPSVYFKDLENKNDRLKETLKHHLIPDPNECGIPENDYFKFLNSRARLILDEISRKCGEITTPREDERQKEIEKVEIQIRDLIDIKLTNLHGRDYWDISMPQEICVEVSKRIDRDMQKLPNFDEAALKLSRKRLDYCNVMEYLKIIESKTNWSIFEPVFRKRGEIQRYLLDFSDYRNTIMHNREMQKLVRMKGETALVWFSSVLEEHDTNTDDFDPNIDDN